MDALTAPLLAHARGELPAGVAVMRLCGAATTADEARAVLAAAEARGGPLPEARALLTDDAFALVKRVLVSADHACADDPAGWAATFDRLAAVSPDAGSALYALGDAARLEAATAEVASWLVGEGLVAAGTRILEIGCGSGRFQRALAEIGAVVFGLDVSVGMARAARTGGGAVCVGSGRDLAAVADGAAELVLAVDSWPYLVNAGVERTHLLETARVLRPGGRLVVLNWSYGDEAGASALAEAVGFATERAGDRPFRLWDGRAFVFRRE